MQDLKGKVAVVPVAVERFRRILAGENPFVIPSLG